VGVSEKRRLLAKLLPRLLDFIYDRGDECEIEEVKRSQAQADANAQSGAGIANSLHVLGLAVDLSMFVDGNYSTQLEDYRAAGEFWCSLDSSCRWGGHFASPDVDHFSITHGGVC
jgi:hypothetical protein